MSLVDRRTEDTTPCLSLRISHQDENLTERELKQFLQSLEDAELIALGATQRSIASYDTLGIEVDGDRALNVDIALPLNISHMEAIFGQGQQAVESAAVEVQVRLYRRFGKRALMDLLDDKGGGAEHFILGALGGRNVRREIRRMSGLQAGVHKGRKAREARVLAMVVGWLASNAEDLWDYVEGIHDLRSTPIPAIQPGQRLDQGFEKDMEEQHRRLVEELDGWMAVRGGIRRFVSRDERVSLWSLALLATLQKLSGRSRAGRPIVSWKDGDGLDRRIALM